MDRFDIVVWEKDNVVYFLDKTTEQYEQIAQQFVNRNYSDDHRPEFFTHGMHVFDSSDNLIAELHYVKYEATDNQPG